MKINKCNIQNIQNTNITNNKPKKELNQQNARSYNESGLNNIAAYNKANITFKGYYGD